MGGFFLFEFGSNSLKFHFRTDEDGEIRKYKVPWRIGYEIFRTGSISKESMDLAIHDVQEILVSFGKGCDPGKVIAFATGAFREARNILEFVSRIRVQTGLKVRVITGDQEAALLKSLYLEEHPDLPEESFVFDLGSGSFQWVHIDGRFRSERGSLPIGAIRLLESAVDGEGNFSPDRAYHLAARYLAALPRIEVRKVTGTGGTVRALCNFLGRRRVSRGALEGLILRIRRDGPPSSLKPHRAPLFLPGLVMVGRLLEDLHAEEICHEDLSVGKALLEKVLPFYGSSIAPRPTEVWGRIWFSEVLPRREVEASA
jgi:exopolyphosphatase/guanosine-5'-triphosphate,3'-diphosphate pyrophosphatase